MCVKLGALNDACANLFGAGSGNGCQFGLMCPTFPGGRRPSACCRRCRRRCTAPAIRSRARLTPTPACGVGMYCQLQYTAGAACNASRPARRPAPTATPRPGRARTRPAVPARRSSRRARPAIRTTRGLFSFVDSQCADGSLCYKLARAGEPDLPALRRASADCKSARRPASTCQVGLSCNAAQQVHALVQRRSVLRHDRAVRRRRRRRSPPASPTTPTRARPRPARRPRTSAPPARPASRSSLCASADNAGTSYCAPTGSSGVCAPKCF